MKANLCICSTGRASEECDGRELGSKKNWNKYEQTYTFLNTFHCWPASNMTETGRIITTLTNIFTVLIKPLLGFSWPTCLSLCCHLCAAVTPVSSIRDCSVNQVPPYLYRIISSHHHLYNIINHSTTICIRTVPSPVNTQFLLHATANQHT